MIKIGNSSIVPGTNKVGLKEGRIQRRKKPIESDTIYFYTISFLTLGMLFYAFLMVNEKQMRIKEDMERTKPLRTKAGAGRKGA